MEAITTRRQRHCNAAERAEWVSRYYSSQLSQEQFTQQHGLKLGTLQRWLREERQRSSLSTEASAFQEVRLPSFLPMIYIGSGVIEYDREPAHGV